MKQKCDSWPGLNLDYNSSWALMWAALDLFPVGYQECSIHWIRLYLGIRAPVTGHQITGLLIKISQILKSSLNVFSLQPHAPFLPWSNVRNPPSLVGAACSLTMTLLWGLCSLLLWSGNFKIHRRLFPVLVWCERGPVQKSVFSTTLCSSLLKRGKCFAWRN